MLYPLSYEGRGPRARAEGDGREYERRGRRCAEAFSQVEHAHQQPIEVPTDEGTPIPTDNVQGKPRSLVRRGADHTDHELNGVLFVQPVRHAE